ncbi:hypothetical protein AB0M46_24065, partial [Dactylosporangium sp. NPDC051485]
GHRHAPPAQHHNNTSAISDIWLTPPLPADPGQTRERKISEFVAMLARHETVYPQKAKPANPP